MKRRLNLLLLSMILFTALATGYGVWVLARAAFVEQLEHSIQLTDAELAKKFHAFDLFMQELEREMDLRLRRVMPKIAERIRTHPDQTNLSPQALRTLAAEFKVRDIYLIDKNLTVFNTSFAPDMGLNLGGLSDHLRKMLTNLLGRDYVEVDRIAMSSQTGIIKKYAYAGSLHDDYLVEISVNMWEGAETFGSEAQKRFFLGEFFQSIVDSNKLLLELDLFIADDQAQWSLLHEGTAMDPEIAAQMKGKSRLEIRDTHRLSIYTALGRHNDVTGFRYYGKTVFNTTLPRWITHEIPYRLIGLTLFATLVAYLLLERMVHRWFLTRVATIDSGIQRMSQGDYATPIVIRGQDEISRIAQAINGLAEQILLRETELRNGKMVLEQRVTKRTQALQESLKILKKSEADYRYLVENAQSSIVRWRPDGTITFFNEYAQRFFGYTESEILGRSLFDTIVATADENGRDLRALLLGIAQNPDMFGQNENENTIRSGERVWVSWANRGIKDESGKIKEILSVGANVTHLKQIQRELVMAKNAAESSNRAKSAFLAVMSHEIRTPLNAILGMAELLAEAPLSSEQQRYVHILNNAGNTLLSLINDILDLSKIEADRLELERTELDLEQMVDDLAEMMAIRAREKGLALVTRFDAHVNPHRMGDSARIRQILINLTGNAIKFSDHGQVTITVSEPESGLIHFAVEDTGIGIAQEKQESIFRPFTQSDASITRRFGGTGLGLNICKRLVECMNGTIGVSSKPGKGSRFYFTIPLPPVAGSEAVAKAGMPQGTAVLLAGSGLHFSVIAELLAKSNLTVTVQQGFEQVMATLNQPNAPTIVVLDSGDVAAKPALEVAARIRNSLPLAQCGLLILIPEPDHDAFFAANQQHAFCLAKPVRRSDLLEALHNLWKQNHLPPLLHMAPPPSHSSVATKPPLRLLLAEDSLDNTILIQSYLKSEPFQLICVDNGRDALEKAKAERFDVILMDVQMPELDGLSVTRALRAFEQASGQPPTYVLALTAHAMPEDESMSLNAGCDGHLNKPIRKKNLLEAIYAFHNRHNV
ncbi:MAG: response regulator [Magnetococcales bacterium]|nr:response regulator [Magnetococcales bacterium]